MIENGFEVRVYDFSPIINPKLFALREDSPMSHNDYFLFHDKKTAINAISKTISSDFIICTLYYTRINYWVYKGLSLSSTFYSLIVSLAIPDRDLNESILSRVSKKTSLLLLYRMILNIPYRSVFSRIRRIRGPNFIIAGGDSSLEYYKMLVPKNNAEIIWTHGMDYDIYLQHRSDNVKKKTNKVVFIDVGVLSSSGDYMTSDAPYTKNISHTDKYFPHIRKYFTEIERVSGCEIVIAVHPGPFTHSDEFGEREVVSGKTCELIQNSDFVITHNSTAISFAVIMKKPIIFITTDNYESTPLNASILHMANSLGRSVTNIDSDYSVDFSSEMLINSKLYNSYNQKYIKVDGTEEVNSWQIVANKILRL